MAIVSYLGLVYAFEWQGFIQDAMATVCRSKGQWYVTSHDRLTVFLVSFWELFHVVGLILVCTSAYHIIICI